MDTLSIQRRIWKTKLSEHAKLIGVKLAFHLNRKTGTIRVSQDLLIEECSCSRKTVSRAIKELLDAGIFTAKRTGRATIFTPIEMPQASGKNSGRVEVPSQTHLMCPTDASRTYNNPFSLDVGSSTPAEEKHKTRMARRDEAEARQQ